MGQVQIKKGDKESIVQQIIGTITDLMIEGKLKPGDRLPPEPYFAQDLGVARTSVREAIKILNYMGVLESKRSKGTFVTQGFHESMIDPMVYGLILSNREDVQNLMEIRHMIEVGMVGLAIKNKDASSMANLLRALEHMEANALAPNAEALFDAHFEADEEFHRALAEVGKNPLADKLNRVVRTLTYALRYQTVSTLIREGRAKQFAQAHRDIYELVRDGQTEHIGETIHKSYFLDDVEFDHLEKRSRH